MKPTAEGVKAPETLPENIPDLPKAPTAEGVKAPETVKGKEVTFKCKFSQICIGNDIYIADPDGNVTVPADVAKDARSRYEVQSIGE